MRDLSMHIMDIFQNSIKAKATNIKVFINEDIKNNQMIISIEDNGIGMNKETLNRIKNPFVTSRDTRDVGLGIPLLEQTCINSNGSLEIISKEGVGTKVTAVMEYENIDRPPLGDIINTVYLLILTNEQIDFLYKHKKDNNEYEIDTKEIKEILGDMSFQDTDVSSWIKNNISEGLYFSN